MMVLLPRSIPAPEPSVRYVEIRPSDRSSIAARVYEPGGPAHGTVLLHGATAVPQRFYARFATFLAEQQLRTVTYDYRGIGSSRPYSLRGFDATILEWAEKDARAVIDWTRAMHPGPLASIGHSFGGQILALIDEAHLVDRTILVASQFGYYGHWNGAERVKLGLLWKLATPALTRIFGYLPGRAGLGEDLPAGVARQWARWCSSPNYLLDHVAGSAERLERFDKPTLAFSFTDDEMAPRSAVQALLERLPRARLDHQRIEPTDVGMDRIGHFGFFREAARETLWPRALRFLDGRTAFVPKAPEHDKEPVPQADPLWRISHEEVLADLRHGR